MLKAPFSEVGEKPEGNVKCFQMCPTIPLHEILDTVKEVLDFIPSFCVKRMSS